MQFEYKTDYFPFNAQQSFYEYHYFVFGAIFTHKMKFTNSLVPRLSLYLYCNAGCGKLGGSWDEAIHLFLSRQDHQSQQWGAFWSRGAWE